MIPIILAPQDGIPIYCQYPQPQDIPVLRALSQIESGDNDHAIGLKGERSRYQITKKTWIRYSNYNFTWANHQHISQHVAFAIYLHNGDEFIKINKRYPSPIDNYLMWNLGFNGYKKRNFDPLLCPTVSQDAALRYSNLYLLYTSQN